MKNEYDALVEKSNAQSSKNDDAIASLEEQLSDEKKSRNEERFLYIFLALLCINIYAFSQMSNWGSPVALLIFELIGLVIIANKLGIEYVVRFFDQIIALLNVSQK